MRPAWASPVFAKRRGALAFLKVLGDVGVGHQGSRRCAVWINGAPLVTWLGMVPDRSLVNGVPRPARNWVPKPFEVDVPRIGLEPAETIPTPIRTEEAC
jgi:hypothetical protein